MEDVIGACVTSLVVFSKAWIVFVLFQISQTNFGISIEIFFSLVVVCHIASEPFIKSHSAHDVVIGHRVKTVKCVLYFLFWSYSGLEASS